MTKLQYVIWGAPGSSVESFSRRVLEALVPRLLDHEPVRLKVTFTASEPPRLAVVPFGRRRVALISLWEREERVGAVDWHSLMAAPDEELAGYEVTESSPMLYIKDWPDGERTPGAGLLTLFRRRPGLDDAELIRRWHGVHTPHTVRSQPNWSYVRNKVERPLIEGSPPFDGIVEEHFRTRQDLLDPVRFFGGAWTPERATGRRLMRMVPNMVKMGMGVQRFLDMKTLETYLVDEVHVRS